MAEPSAALTDPRLEALFEAPAIAARLAEHRISRAIALELVALRREAGLGVRELARIAGWDPAFVARLEAGRGAVPTPASLLRYARACGAEVGYVLRRSGEERVVLFEDEAGEPMEPRKGKEPGGSGGAEVTSLAGRQRSRRTGGHK